MVATMRFATSARATAVDSPASASTVATTVATRPARRGGERIEVRQTADAREPLVDDQPLAHVGDVRLRDERGDPQLDLRLHLGLRRLATRLPHRLLQHVGVELEADGRDVAGLLLAEE